jgi:hypothetical protein
MSDVPTATLWRVTGAKWLDTDEEFDSISLLIRSNGEDYAVACTGPKGMKSDQFISAIRAAAAALIQANGGDITTVGAAHPDLFDTGDQHAN